MNRRKFLGIMASGGLLFTSVYRLFNYSSNNPSFVFPSGGDYYSGFVILDQNEPTPLSIRTPDVALQHLCFVDHHPDSNDMAAAPIFFNTISELRSIAVKNNLYHLEDPAGGYSFLGAYIMLAEDGTPYGVSQGYKSSSDSINVSFWSELYFAKPFPVWNQAATDKEHSGIEYKKVSYLPSAGLEVSTPLGFVFHWIEGEILYVLSVEHCVSLDEAIKILGYLVKS